MDILESINNHPSEESLEAYLLRQLDRPRVAHLEEHLLVCDHCRQTLEELEEYVTVMKCVTATYTGSAVPQRLLQRFNPFARRAGKSQPGAAPRNPWFPLAWGSAVAAFCFLAVLSWNFRPVSPVLPATAVELSAFRGGGDSFPARAPAGAPLELTIDAADLGAAEDFNFRMEIVDEVGTRMWSAPAKPSGSEQLSARVDKILGRGQYFVRVYRGSSPNDPGELMREASLLLE